MKHRQFKTECICMVTINGEAFICNELRGAKKKIYAKGTRGEKYRVDVIDKTPLTLPSAYMQSVKEYIQCLLSTSKHTCLICHIFHHRFSAV